MKKTLSLSLIALSLQAHGAEIDSRTEQRLKAVVAGEHRSQENRDRDRYRHPAETLGFFGIADTQTVVEIYPGSGWYTEILAPLLKPHGKLYEASYSDSDANSTPYQIKATVALKKKLADNLAVYGPVTVTTLQPPSATTIAPPGSADLVLTFRNVHNWAKDGTAETVFASFFTALKPGGVLGVVEHRANPDSTLAQSIKSGYMTEAKVISLAEQAGFKMAARSEINGNPWDMKNYAEGVWALPPTLNTTPDNRARYLAIGESDRMTLKFVKPGR
ncbi:methyltransferase [Herbaspirillum sp. RTI4]|uniref:class I SAM-dependent methyltransferase n=1 Tax=Herbaspirillum sp. RTI4 TaxID=3048640 RepID=UPI002AB59B28|nr:methyltransferase [Herbaspirillum sp. RTI4]MDY7579286.1 methyltransferase [Herbaspirillum sp. RTI4]MEA9982785.1 methyltransferase [Herbaspirillum sp. RTI4]